MSKEAKFGYGFLLAGVGLPYIIEKFLGATPAAIVAIICLIIGFALLVAGHRHNDERGSEIQSLFRGAIPSAPQAGSPALDPPQPSHIGKPFNWHKEWTRIE